MAVAMPNHSDELPVSSSDLHLSSHWNRSLDANANTGSRPVFQHSGLGFWTAIGVFPNDRYSANDRNPGLGPSLMDAAHITISAVLRRKCRVRLLVELVERLILKRPGEVQFLGNIANAVIASLVTKRAWHGEASGGV